MPVNTRPRELIMSHDCLQYEMPWNECEFKRPSLWSSHKTMRNNACWTKKWLQGNPTHVQINTQSVLVTVTAAKDILLCCLAKAIVAAMAPCNVFDFWVPWKRGQVGIWGFVHLGVFRKSELIAPKTPELKKQKVSNAKFVMLKMSAEFESAGIKSTGPFLDYSCQLVPGAEKYGVFGFLSYLLSKANSRHLLLSTLGWKMCPSW